MAAVDGIAARTFGYGSSARRGLVAGAGLALVVFAIFVASSSPAFAGRFAAIAAATLVSEDLTSIGVGLLVHESRIDPWLGIDACLAGILAGDLMLWGIGRLAGQAALRWRFVRRRTAFQTWDEVVAWFERRGGVAILTARFVPGARLPVYLAAGAMGVSATRFFIWALFAASLWVPLLVFSVAWGGGAVAAPLERLVGSTWFALPLAAVLLYAGGRTLAAASNRSIRLRWMARCSTLWRWEFWPSWLLYLPLLPWLAWLSLRHRSATVWTAANPGIPDGGVVGESKADILRRLPPEFVLPFALIPAVPIVDREQTIRQTLLARHWRFPLILKPDASQRGAGVKLARDLGDVLRYAAAHPAPFLIQVYHPGPFEAGVFYFRYPGKDRGRIFSITDKVFPVVVGDGRSTLAQLVWDHPRYRMQAATFLARHMGEADRVLPAGQPFRLAVAGNHCQGTMFRDGTHLITPRLEEAIDRISRHFSGFYFGRFDIRYCDADAFKAGRDLWIVELNGVTSESTNIYDPARSLWSAYRTLFRQWSLAFAIGAACRNFGTRPTGVWALCRSVQTYYRHRGVVPRAD